MALIKNKIQKSYDALRKVRLFIDRRILRWDGLPNLAKIGFVRTSPIFLFIIPAMHQIFYPLLILPPGTRVELVLNWLRLCRLLGGRCENLEGLSIAFEIGMPFSLLLIYLAVFFFSAATIIFQVLAPRFLGREEPIDTPQYIMQNFREVAKELSGERSNFFVDHFLKAYADNYDGLKSLSPEAINRIREMEGYPELAPLADRACQTRMNDDSIYYYAVKMTIKEEKWDRALETIVWFQNETRWLSRYLCGACFAVAISISLYLIFRGFMRMILY